MEKEIGGYFELDLSKVSSNSLEEYTLRNLWNIDSPSHNFFCLNTGRNSIELVLRSIPKISCLYIPYFTCSSVLEPLDKLNLPYRFYSINFNLEMEEHFSLKENEYILYTNYFGIKDEYVERLHCKYGDSLIVDNAQALYANPVGKCTYSPRKYVGLPDGGFAFCNDPSSNICFDKSHSYDLCSHLLKRIDCGAGAGYADFKDNSKKLSGLPILGMSNLTARIFQSIDLKEVQDKRRKNFEYLHHELKLTNQLSIPSFDSFACPMVYPYYIESDSLRTELIKNKVFVATYWPNVLNWCKEDTVEHRLAKYILPLPIDQRYSIEDMDFIINIIKENESK